MTLWTLVLRGLTHHWRTQLGVLAGMLVATAVLVGALVVGDSVRLSLAEQARERVGSVQAALVARERFFREELASELAADLGSRTTPLLQLPGVASISGGSARTGIVDVLGVRPAFFALGPAGRALPALEPETCTINSHLARQLQASPGDTLVLRVEKPSPMPRDMVMATVDDVSFAIRLKVAGVVEDEDFGRFGLRASQLPPFAVHVDLAWLQQELELSGQVNGILLGAATGEGGAAETSAALVTRADAALRARWQLADAQISSVAQPELGTFAMETGRIFLDPPVAEALREIEPGLVGILTYFVNEIRAGEAAAPYAIVSALGLLDAEAAPADPALRDLLQILPDGIVDGQFVANDWLAADLGLAAGDPVTMSYFVMGTQLGLETESADFGLVATAPLDGIAGDADLMPQFPGLADTEHCRDWEPGIPVDLQRLRPQDEEYWEQHQGAPKAFLSLAAGRRIWANRFGDLTAVRGPLARKAEIEKALLASVDPAQLGLFFQDVAGPALATGTSATDFGALFLGLSFFLITAGLLLTSLLFLFGVEQRANEIGMLLALGYRPRQVRRLFVGEALGLAVLGAVLGAGAGLLYTQGVLYGLGTLWRDAVGATALGFHARPLTVAIGVVASVLVAWMTLRVSLRRSFDLPALELLTSRSGIPARATERGSARRSFQVAALFGVAGLALVLTLGGSAQQAAGAFFGGGALVLLSGLALCRGFLVRLGGGAQSLLHSVGALGKRNAGRRVRRSLTTVALLASGTFLVVAVQANRLQPPQDPWLRDSGTGGFALYGRSTLPVLRDLDSEAGRDVYGLDERDLEGVSIVPLRLREGDDASCLSLSLPQRPRLLGVDAQKLADRGAFAFAGQYLEDGQDAPASPWELLQRDYGDGVVPAIGDGASITWAMHKSLGDRIEYVDERGESFEVLLVGAVSNSILQGDLLIDDARFAERFPSSSGFKTFLVDVPRADLEQTRSDLTRAFEDIGLELTPSGERLAAFQAVQNTYLLIFQALGGLGLLLGSVGLGMVVLRNTLERRGELAIASALGFSPRAVRRIVWAEHAWLLLAGLGTGVVAALVGVLPGLRSGEADAPALLGFVALVGLSGAFWTALAIRIATRPGRSSLVEALRSE